MILSPGNPGWGVCDDVYKTEAVKAVSDEIAEELNDLEQKLIDSKEDQITDKYEVVITVRK